MQTPPDIHSTKKPAVHYETIYAVDPKAHTIIWGGGRLPALFRAEHAHTLSTIAEEKTRYETRASFAGVSAYPVRRFMGESIEVANRAMAEALKKRAEGAEGKSS